MKEDGMTDDVGDRDYYHGGRRKSRDKRSSRERTKSFREDEEEKEGRGRGRHSRSRERRDRSRKEWEIERRYDHRRNTPQSIKDSRV